MCIYIYIYVCVCIHFLVMYICNRLKYVGRYGQMQIQTGKYYFRHLKFQKVVRSRHKGVQFFIFCLASSLRIRRFSEPTFQPPGATKHWKKTVFRDFLTF